MKRTGTSQFPLNNNAIGNDLNKNNLNNFQRPKAYSYQSIQLSSDLSHKFSRRAQQPNDSLEHQIERQFVEDYENVSNYKVNEMNEADQQTRNERRLYKNNKTSQNSLYNRQMIGQPSHTPRSRHRVFNQTNNMSRFNQIPRFTQPQVFQQVQLSQTLEDQQEDNATPLRSISARDLRRFKFNQMKSSEQLDLGKHNHNINMPSKQRDIGQQLQQKAIYQNFRVSDLNFLSDQQLLPQGMHPQKSSNRSNKNSKHSESNHPVFRDTLDYVDANNLNVTESFADYNRESEVSEQSQEQSSQITNDDRQSFKVKYKKYKLKYMNLVDVVKQFETLNETLIRDQRQNFLYYEDTIRNLQNLLVMKDKEIEDLSIHLSKMEDEGKIMEPTSIEGRNLEIQNQRLKKELEAKDKEINALKENIKTVNANSRITQRNKEGISKNLQKKNDFLKKQKEALTKKVNSFQQINRTYEQKLREKEERLIRLFEMNSELQEQNIKLKGKIKYEQTYDTERTFAPIEKQSRNHLIFSGQTFSKVPFILSPQKDASTSEIEKYLACIDQQLHLIRTSVINEKDNRGIPNLRKKQMNEQDFVSESDFEEMIRQSNQKIPYKELQNVVQKLSSFRASMGA